VKKGRIDKETLLRVIDTRRWTFSENIYSYPETGTQVVVKDIGSHIVVAFRETDSFDNEPVDTYNHVAFRTVKCNGQDIQWKYLKAVQVAFLDVVRHVMQMCETNNKKVITYGHSLGGAKAVIFATMLKEKFPYLFSDMVVTTGATRPFGWFSPTDKLDFSIFRFTHQFDWAGLVAPWFKHGCKNIQIGKPSFTSWAEPYDKNSHNHTNYVYSILDDKREVFTV